MRHRDSTHHRAPGALALAAAALAAAGAPSARAAEGEGPAGDGRFAVRAQRLHVGDGTTRANVTVVVERGVVQRIQPATAPVPEGWPLHECVDLVPGLVAAGVAPPHRGDQRSVAPDRMAVELVDHHAAFDEWLAAGMTALAVSPGDARLVGGRGGVLRLTPETEKRVHVRGGPVVASLTRAALGPPDLFEPDAPVNVDAPLPAAVPQRPHTAMAAVAELRRLLTEARDGGGDPALRAVARREVTLRVRAETAAEIRRALSLVRELGLDAVLEGGREAWRVADEIAQARVPLVLALPEPGLPPREDESLGEYRADAPAILARAGVELSLTARSWLDGDLDRPLSPLALAAAAVRHGLPERDAVAAVTARAARAMGAPDLGWIRVGAPADLVALDAPALALRARPSATWVGGRQVSAAAREPAADLLAVHVGVLRADGRTMPGGVLLTRDGVVAGLLPSASAVPVGTDVHDFGPAAHLVPGLIDCFSRVGTEPGRPTGGRAALAAEDALEADRPDLARALAAGVTSALAVPDARGVVLGSAAIVSTDVRPADGDGPDRIEVIESGAGLVFVLGGGPEDRGPRGPRVEGLKRLLKKAKGYHDRLSGDAKGADDKGRKGRSRSKGAADKKADHPRPPSPDRRRAVDSKSAAKKSKKPERSDELDAYGPLFAGKAQAFLRVGRHDTILAGLDAFKTVGLTPVVVGGEEADLVAEELAKRDVVVILGPRALRREPGRTVNVAAELRQAGVPVALGSFEPGGAELLPLAAALAVRDGLSPADALDALTGTAARAIGAPDGLGRLAPGDRADAVVFSGDPLEPASRVLAVIVRGRLVVPADDADAGRLEATGQ